VFTQDTRKLTEQKYITTQGTQNAKALYWPAAFLCFLLFSVICTSSAVKNLYSLFFINYEGI